MLFTYLNGALSLLCFFLGLPLLFKKVKPNTFFGFRTRKTLSSEKIWYAANFRAGLLIVLTALLFGATAWVTLAFSVPAKTAGYLTLIPVGVFLFGAILNFIWLQKIPRPQ